MAPGTNQKKKKQTRIQDESPTLTLAAVTVLLTIVALCAATWVHAPYWPSILFSVFSLAGALLCWSIVMHLAGKDNPITRQFCSTEGKFDCDRVLEQGKLSNTLSLADLGLMYFFMQFLFLWLGAATATPETALTLLSVPATLAVATTIGLLIWQGFVIKHWCRMCLLVTGVLWMQLLSIAILSPGSFRSLAGLPATAYYSFTISACIASLWMISKPWLASMEQNKRIKTMLNKWKKNTDFFWILLKEQRMAVGLQDWDNEIVLGDPLAPDRLVFVMGPYCPICAREFPQLSLLLRKPGIRLGASIRFSVKNPGDHRSHAVKKIFDACAAYPDPADHTQILRDWYRLMDIVAFTAKWPLTSTGDLEPLLERHHDWTLQNKILTTPVYFLNGREIPDIYKISDLYVHLSGSRSSIKNLSE